MNDDSISKMNVNSLDNYSAYRDKLIELVKNSPNLSEAISSGDLTENDIAGQVDNYLATIPKYSEYYNQFSKLEEQKKKIADVKKAFSDSDWIQNESWSIAEERLNDLNNWFGGKINAKGAKIYGNSYGGGKSNQYFANDPIYTVLGENNGYWKVRYHKLSSGVTGWFKKGDVKAYKTGGLVDYTGLAQLDGTPGKPELVLNSKDTDNFIGLRDALRAMASQPLTMGNTTNFDESYKKYIPEITGITNVKNRVSDLSNPTLTQNITFGDINIPIDHVDDYNDLMRKIQRDPKFEQMIRSMSTDLLGGGSSLAKHRFHWK